MSDFWLYLQLGFTHVLDWQAYDHMLFLTALVVAYTFFEWKRVFWLVTMFTIGHTLSLTLSAYGVVYANADWVEFLIPVTILLTAFYDLFTAGKKKQTSGLGFLFFITLAFGTIHGLGFSTYFKVISDSINNKLPPLLEFALGIELAQIVVVFVVLFLAFVFQRIFNVSKRDWVLVLSALVIGRAVPMLVSHIFW